MAYQAIYRKWRPLVFEDIVGQTHVTRTLKNQIQTGHISHAYLFCGTRGTGKTTAAKVFARAVNCLHPVDGTPCNTCEICQGILDGSILDVTEIDAASNNGVDNIREIREDVNYVATQTKYRVYIIDEVHMLSAGAFNALLKTLEEPPAHVIFILATTEAHKVPETILSRCQRFDFKRIRPADIILRMKEIAAGDGLSITEDAYALLARLAEGSMRDGLSILERCVSACGTNLTYENITDTLGIAQSDLIFSIAESVAAGDTGAVLSAVDRLSADGKDLNVFCDTLIRHFRDLLVIQSTNAPEDILDYTPEELIRLRGQAERLPFAKLTNAVGVLTKAHTDAKWVKNPRIIYELALLKLTRPALDSTPESMEARLAELENAVKNGVQIAPAVQSSAPAPEKPPEKQPKKEVSAQLYAPLDKSTLTADHPLVLAARKWDKAAQAIAKKYPFVAGSVFNRKITIDGEGILLLYSKQELMLKKIASTYLSSIQEVFRKNTGTDYAVKAVFEEDVADYIIDFWNVAPAKGAPAPQPAAPAENTPAADPLDTLAASFPEIIEYTDESEFVDYRAEDDHFEQAAMGDRDEDDREEFLEDGETPSDDNE